MINFDIGPFCKVRLILTFCEVSFHNDWPGSLGFAFRYFLWILESLEKKLKKIYYNRKKFGVNCLTKGFS